jgi:error-prone DNA polymerase
MATAISDPSPNAYAVTGAPISDPVHRTREPTHGVEVRPVCITASRWDSTLEPLDDDKFAVRLGFRQVRGLANNDGAEIVAARADRPFESIDDLWRRADVPVASLVQLAEADAMNESLGLARRGALWALKALRNEPLELFAAAAAREARTIEEVREPAVSLRPMTSGGEVVEDYRHVGLTLRQHPASFLRADLASRRIVTCIEAMNARDGKWLTTAGLVPHGRGDEFHHGSPGVDPRSLPPKPRDIYVPDLHIDSIKVKTRDFR